MPVPVCVCVLCLCVCVCARECVEVCEMRSDRCDPSLGWQTRREKKHDNKNNNTQIIPDQKKNI